MRTLTKQILIRVDPELDALVDRAFSKYLRETGLYISRSNFIRDCLERQCKIALDEDDAHPVTQDTEQS
jgi:Arc/MetJ-type ribon-helix-helix transcriptional regulator